MPKDLFLFFIFTLSIAHLVPICLVLFEFEAIICLKPFKEKKMGIGKLLLPIPASHLAVNHTGQGGHDGIVLGLILEQG